MSVIQELQTSIIMYQCAQEFVQVDPVEASSGSALKSINLMPQRRCSDDSSPSILSLSNWVFNIDSWQPVPWIGGMGFFLCFESLLF